MNYLLFKLEQIISTDKFEKKNEILLLLYLVGYLIQLMITLELLIECWLFIIISNKIGSQAKKYTKGKFSIKLNRRRTHIPDSCS